ncbi:IacB protein [Tepidiphilus sp. HLB4]
MSEKSILRVLFCIGVNQNFMDAADKEMRDVWDAFVAMMQGISRLPGVRVLGVLDDDRIMVGPSSTFPWTTYILADVPDYDTVIAACNLLRITPVGDGTHKLWKYMRVEARIGRELVIPN